MLGNKITRPNPKTNRMDNEVVHATPFSGASRTPCCHTVVFELPYYSRMTISIIEVTCDGWRDYE